MKAYLAAILISIAFIFQACDNGKRPAAPVSSIRKAPDPSQERNEALKRAVSDWNEAQNTRNVLAFSNMYASKVKFYGRNLSKRACVGQKLDFLQKHPRFRQQISGDIQVDSLNALEYKCSFQRKVSLGGQDKNYPTYLVLHKYTDGWKIVTEGDSLSDKKY